MNSLVYRKQDGEHYVFRWSRARIHEAEMMAHVWAHDTRLALTDDEARVLIDSMRRKQAEEQDSGDGCMIDVGDHVRLTEDIYDDGGDCHPPGYIGRKGEVLIVRKISHGGKGGQRIYVSHSNITDNSFLVYPNEFAHLATP